MRSTPFGLVFGEIATERFPAIAQALRQAGSAPADRDQFVLLEPVGEGNPEPVFELSGEVSRSEIVGEGHLKLWLRLGAHEIGAFGYELGSRRPEPGAQMRVYGHLRPDSWRGGDAIELRILDLE